MCALGSQSPLVADDLHARALLAVLLQEDDKLDQEEAAQPINVHTGASLYPPIILNPPDKVLSRYIVIYC